MEHSDGIDPPVSVAGKFMHFYTNGEYQELFAILHESIVFTIPGPSEFPLFREWKGIEELKKLFQLQTSLLDYLSEAQEYICQGKRVVVKVREWGKLKNTRKSFDSQTLYIMTVENGKIYEISRYMNTHSLFGGYIK